MKKPQVTTTTGVSGILGMWLAVFGTAMPSECMEIIRGLTVQEWVSLVAPTLVCLWSIIANEDKRPGV